MTHRIAMCFVIASLAFGAPRPVAAELPPVSVFDTVDAVEIMQFSNIAHFVVTGIPAGGTTPGTFTFFFYGSDAATQCQRFAMIAMSKPGKYKFAIGAGDGGRSLSGRCKLSLVTP